MKLFVTGGAGFIGSNYVRYVLGQHRRRGHRLRRAHLRRQPGEPRATSIDDRRCRSSRATSATRTPCSSAMAGHDAVVHFAAESHVDRSIVDPDAFVRTNCVGTNVLCDVARQVGVERFLHISTDEVYGSIEDGSFAETDPLDAPLAVLGVEGRLATSSPSPTTRPTACRSSSPGARTTSGRTSSPRRSSRCSSPTCSTARRCRSTATACNVRDWLLRRGQLRGGRPRAAPGRGRRDLQHRRRQRDHQPRARRPPARAARAGDEIVIEPVADRLGHDRRYSIDHRQDRGARLEARARPRRGARRDRRLVPRQPGVVGAAQGRGAGCA